MPHSTWDEKELIEKLNTKVIGNRFEIYQETGSTNQKALEMASNGAEEGMVVLAELQTEGRGRLGREWISPPGVGIYTSVLLRPECSVAELPKFTLLAGVAVAEAVREVTGLPAAIKWPNDVLLQGKKFCGILEESFIVGNKIRYIVVGIGINVNTDPAHLPTTRGKPTSLKAEKGSQIDRSLLLATVLNKLDSGYLDIRQGKGGDLIHRWRGLSCTLGRQVRVQLAEGAVEGRAMDIDDDGGLLISTQDGGVQKVMAGDIIFLGQ
jgi:BirA family biotin operon repressor/biotin-[acetyl-CoA-carboxylase] ligase